MPLAIVKGRRSRSTLSEELETWDRFGIALRALAACRNSGCREAFEFIAAGDRLIDDMDIGLFEDAYHAAAGVMVATAQDMVLSFLLLAAFSLEFRITGRELTFTASAFLLIPCLCLWMIADRFLHPNPPSELLRCHVRM